MPMDVHQWKCHHNHMSTLTDTIIGANARIRGAQLRNSLIGDHVIIEGLHGEDLWLQVVHPEDRPRGRRRHCRHQDAVLCGTGLRPLPARWRRRADVLRV